MSTEVVYGGFWRRFAAVVIDTLIFMIPMIIVEMMLPYVGGLLLGVFYAPVFESSALQTTPGKYAMGLRVQASDGTRLSFVRALIRYVMKTVSCLLLMIGYIMQVFTNRRQTLHDMAADAVVVHYKFESSPRWLNEWTNRLSEIFGYTERKASSQISKEAENRGSVLSSIEKLHELHRQGALSDEEFQAKKAEMLKNI